MKEKSEKPKGLYEEIDEVLLEQKRNKESVEIENLTKKYPNGKVAVNNLNLSFFKNEIFALLGHNGAGKTTTISMVSGLLSSTSGSIKALGFDAIEDRDKIQSIMAICPQTNPIYPLLTCEEHLELYAHVKDTKKNKEELNEEIDEILKDIDLLDKKHFQAGLLSGGQKRKLAVACAFIGGSKIIMLDEPSSGLDVAARRHLWDMLKKYRKDKVVILTTHFMDEADFLGDRIGIMGDGKLITCGRSLFLKNKFGSGYNLTLVKSSPATPTGRITSLIREYVFGATLEDNLSKELRYSLPSCEIDRFQKLFNQLERNKKRYGIESFGVSLTTLEDVFLKVGSKSEKINFSNQETRITSRVSNPRSFEMTPKSLYTMREKRPCRLFMMQFGALMWKRIMYLKRDFRGVMFEMIFPIFVIFASTAVLTFNQVKDPERGVVNSEVFYKDIGAPVVTVNTQFQEFNQNLPTENFIIDSIDTGTIEEFDKAITQDKIYDRMIALHIEEADPLEKIYNYTLFVKTREAHSVHVGLNLANNAILRSATGDQDASIKVIFDPLIPTGNSHKVQKKANEFLGVFLISLAHAFIPASLIAFVVLEREKNAKHQQIVSGVGLLAYWLSNYSVDVAKCLIVGSFTIASFFTFYSPSFIEEGAIKASCALIFSFSFNIVPFCYLASFKFRNHSSAQVSLFLLSTVTGFVLTIIAYITRSNDSMRPFSFYFFEYFCRLFPMFNISFGLFSIIYIRVWKDLFKIYDDSGYWTIHVMLNEFIFMVVEIFVFWGLIFWIELRRRKPSSGERAYMMGDVGVEREDKGVMEEELEVKNNEEYAVKVNNFRKIYKIFVREGYCCKRKTIVREKMAVKGITFGVRQGECFGLLGTNGAGKTTTFKMLTGQINPTAGSAKIRGMDILEDIKEVRKKIGYCPQSDPLIDKLTVKEHLELYAAIKGIRVSERRELIEESLRNLSLARYWNTQAGTLSGGNKRKLSVAISLIGNPPVVLLDEPSSGMDPKARRHLWSVLGNMSTKMKTSSLILTTHSMEEAEALSSKLAIMVEGKIECMGSVQGLKSKYGGGFEIETKINLPSKHERDELKMRMGITDIQTEISKDEVEAYLQEIEKDGLKLETMQGDTGPIRNEVRLATINLQPSLKPRGESPRISSLI